MPFDTSLLDIYNSNVSTAPAADASPAPEVSADAKNVSEAPPEAAPSLQEIAIDAAKNDTPIANKEPDATKVSEAPAPPPAAETPPELKPVVKEDSSARRFAILAKQDRELRAREYAINAKERELEARIAQPVQQAKPSNPFEALRAAGYSLADLNEAILRGQKEAPPPDPMEAKLSPLEQKIKQLEEQLNSTKEETAKERAERAQKEYEGSVAQVMGEIAQVAKNYDLINAFGPDGQQVVFNTIQEVYNQYQKLLTYQEACDMVEKDFEERYLPRFVESNKLKSKLVNTATAPVSKPGTPAQTAKKETKTLTNTQSASGVPSDFDKLSDDEKLMLLATQLKFRT